MWFSYIKAVTTVIWIIFFVFVWLCCDAIIFSVWMLLCQRLSVWNLLAVWTNYSAEAVSKNEAESRTNQTSSLSLSTAVVKTRCHLRLNHSHSLSLSLSLLKWNNSSGYSVIWIINPICISKSRKSHASLNVFKIWVTADEFFFLVVTWGSFHMGYI